MPSVHDGEKKGVTFPGAGILDGCKLPYGWLQLSLGWLGEQKVLLTEPSLQPPYFLLLKLSLYICVRTHTCTPTPQHTHSCVHFSSGTNGEVKGWCCGWSWFSLPLRSSNAWTQPRDTRVLPVELPCWSQNASFLENRIVLYLKYMRARTMCSLIIIGFSCQIR